MAKIGLRKIAELILEDTQELLSPMEIWNKAKTSSRSEIQEKVSKTKGKTPDYSIATEIYTDLKKKTPVFYQPSEGISKFCLTKYKSKFPPEYFTSEIEITTKKREHYHYIIMLDDDPDSKFPSHKKIKIGYGKAKDRLEEYHRTNPEAYTYREWIHHNNIEGDLLDLANIFGKRQSKKGKKGHEVFIIDETNLEKLARHYDEHVFDKRIDVE